ncbi:MAG: SDR family oxidoreductase [Phycisphaerales bacterium]
MADDTNKGACLLIGGAGGIGTELSGLLRDAGWDLVLAGRDSSKTERAAESFGARAVTLDATDFDAVQGVFKDEGPFSAAVNLAGSILIKPAGSTGADEFEHTVNQNLRTAFALVRAASGAMRKTGGSVVLMSSCAAAIGLPNHEAIAAAKAGVEGLVRSAAAGGAPSGIRYNAVAPGLVDTPMAERLTNSDQALKASIAMHPLGRIGTPAEVARAIAFLLDPANDWITGQVLGVDGGLAGVKSR